MSKNPNVEKAALLVANGYIHRGLAWVSIAEAIDAAGLLVTPLHQRALEACKGMYEAYVAVGLSQKYADSSLDARAVGREALALEKPKADEEPDPVIERIKRMWRSVRERNKIPGPLTDALDELIKQPGCEEKPKGQWVVEYFSPGWMVCNSERDVPAVGRVGARGGFTEAQARAVAKALNECDK